MLARGKNCDIRNIFIVIGSALISAGLLTLIFLYYYGPSGRYLAGNALLDPSIIEQINDQDQYSHIGRQVHFDFDRIEFSYFDPKKNQIKKLSFGLDNYQVFYDSISSEKSIQEVSKNIQNLFIQRYPATLTISMRSKEKGKPEVTALFQVVQFIPEDYFRIQLDEKKEGKWVYFYKQGSYTEITSKFDL